MKVITLPCLLTLLVISQGINANDASLSAPKIPWGVSEDKYIKAAQFKPKETTDKVHSFESSKLTTIGGIDFVQTLSFNNKNGLSQISYIANLKNEAYNTKCASLQAAVSAIYGQQTNEVNVKDQGDNNYSEVIWTSKTDRIVRVFCYNLNKNNLLTVSIYPRWIVLDCSMHNANESNKNKKIKRAFFYFDKINEDIRFFNNYEVTLPFDSTFKDQRIAFSHNNNHDNTTIDLGSGVIMSKFSDDKGNEQLMVGTCKKQ